MAGLIQFSIGEDGELALEFERSLWNEMRAAFEAGRIEEKGDFLVVRLIEISTERLADLRAMAPSDAPPCPPIVRFELLP